MNLLQPQDRRSKQPGDSAEAMAARRRLHDSGVTAPLRDAIGEVAQVGVGEAVLDAGCGEGFYLGTLAAATGCRAFGVDISIPSIDAAARRYPGCEWVVANADRFVPYETGAFDVVLSITARMNSPEFRRMLRRDGRLVVAIPAPEDFIEVRGAGRDRVDRTVDAFAREFSLESKRRVSTSVTVDVAMLEDIRHLIYRPMGAGPVAVDRVTLSLDVLLFRPML